MYLGRSNRQPLILALAVLCILSQQVHGEQGSFALSTLPQSEAKLHLDLSCLRGVAARLLDTCPVVAGKSRAEALPDVYAITNQELSQCITFTPLRVGLAGPGWGTQGVWDQCGGSGVDEGMAGRQPHA